MQDIRDETMDKRNDQTLSIEGRKADTEEYRSGRTGET